MSRVYANVIYGIQLKSQLELGVRSMSSHEDVASVVRSRPRLSCHRFSSFVQVDRLAKDECSTDCRFRFSVPPPRRCQTRLYETPSSRNNSLTFWYKCSLCTHRQRSFFQHFQFWAARQAKESASWAPGRFPWISHLGDKLDVKAGRGNLATRTKAEVLIRVSAARWLIDAFNTLCFHAYQGREFQCKLSFHQVYGCDW